MVISHIVGGLGNQMFEYAAGKALAKHLGVELKLDTRDFVKYVDREFMLDCFKIKGEKATPTESDVLIKTGKFPYSKIPYPIRKKIYMWLDRGYYQQPFSHYDPEFWEQPKNVFIKGAFVSPKYFQGVEKEIMRDFQPVKKMHRKNVELANELKRQPSVSVHLRRGDYVSNPKFSRRHGVCSKDYYLAARDFLEKRENKVRYYFFSDDIEWVKKHYVADFSSAVFVKNLGEDWEELALMSQCKHNIIANSTFSWWAAWLNKNKNKIVISPKQWYLDDSIQTRDIYLEDWVRL